MNLPYQVTARLPIGVGDGVVELRAYSSIFGPSELKQTLAAHAARQLAADLLAAANRSTPTPQPTTPRRTPDMTEPLIEASRVKFAGMSSDSLEDPPKLDESRTYTVEATCTAITRERMKDGEMRLVAKMQVDELWEGTGPKPAAESEPGLFDEEDDGSWDEDDTSHDTTGPLPLKSVADPFGGKG